MLGTYSTRSATTNPTGKNRFDAGINGNAIKQSAYEEKEDTLLVKKYMDTKQLNPDILSFNLDNVLVDHF